jgi:hypothetical protein
MQQRKQNILLSASIWGITRFEAVCDVLVRDIVTPYKSGMSFFHQTLFKESILTA